LPFCLMCPAEPVASFAGVTHEEVNLCRPKVPGIDLHKCSTCPFANALLANSVPNPIELHRNVTKRLFDKIADPRRFARGQDVVVGLVLLKHLPHPADVFPCMSPIAFGIKITEIQFLLVPVMNGCNATCDFACNKRLTTQRTLVIE